MNLKQLIVENGGSVPEGDGFDMLFWLWLMAYLNYERKKDRT